MINSYGGVQQLVTKLVHGEDKVQRTKPTRIVRSTRHFSSMKGQVTEVVDYTEDGKPITRTRYTGLHQYNQLANDAIPRDVKSGTSLTDYGTGKHVPNKQALEGEKKQAPVNTEPKSYHSFQGWRYTDPSKRRQELEAMVV